MTHLLGIVGHPLRHTVSPAFQQAALDYYGMDARYEAWETSAEELPQRVEWMWAQGVLGASVTVPHKEAIGGLLNEVEELPRFLGAVNAVVSRDHRLIGYNTDAPGFLRALREDAQFDPKGQQVLVLGAGGVGRTVALTLAAEGVAFLTIANRTLERAHRLVKESPSLRMAEVIPLDPDGLRQRAAHDRWDLIVNCTTVGMCHSEAEGESPIPGELIPSGALVYDLVYNPQETPLLRDARKAGARTLGGLPMLIYQGAVAFQLWTGEEPPLQVMFQAAEEALAREHGREEHIIKG